MFKKSLIALAALGSFAGSAMAADFTISGRIDTGFNYHKGEVTGEEDVESFSMKSGQYSGSRVTIKGSEDLGNGMKAGFVLENGFNGDDGTMGQGGKLFGREAIVYLEGDFGHFSMGRVGALAAGVGSYSFVYNFLPYGTGWGDYAGNKGEFMLGDRDRFNNTITYRSPEFAGVQVFAQYSLDADGQEEAQSGKNKRYAALGATYDLGAFSTGLVVDTIMNGREDDAKNTEDSLGISWGASYDFGVTKPMILVQYGKNENQLAGFDSTMFNWTDSTGAGRLVSNEGLKGFAIGLGAITPLFGGNLYTTVQYADGEFDGDVLSEETKNFDADKKPVWTGADQLRTTGDVQRWGVTIGYDYPLSKRTKVYAFAAYNEGEFKATDTNANGTVESYKDEEKDTEFGFGMIHYF